MVAYPGFGPLNLAIKLPRCPRAALNALLQNYRNGRKFTLANYNMNQCAATAWA